MHNLDGWRREICTMYIIHSAYLLVIHHPPSSCEGRREEQLNSVEFPILYKWIFILQWWQHSISVLKSTISQSLYSYSIVIVNIDNHAMLLNLFKFKIHIFVPVIYFAASLTCSSITPFLSNPVILYRNNFLVMIKMQCALCSVSAALQHCSTRPLCAVIYL